MNLDQAIVRYLEINGSSIKGLMRYIDDSFVSIDKIIVTPASDDDMESILFYNGDEIIYSIDLEELCNVSVTVNDIEEIHFNHVITFGSITGYEYILCIDLDFEGLIR